MDCTTSCWSCCPFPRNTRLMVQNLVTLLRKNHLPILIIYNITHRWFHGIIPRKEAEERLDTAIVGTYLFREAETRPGLSLSVRSVQRKAKRYHSHVATLRASFFFFFFFFLFLFLFVARQFIIQDTLSLLHGIFFKKKPLRFMATSVLTFCFSSLSVVN